MLLAAGDPLPGRPSRVLVAGASGSGKTTLAARIGSKLQLPHVEIDSLYHGPNWTPRQSFVPDVEAMCARPEWVTEWQYGVVRALLVSRADLVVWLDLPRAVVMRQVVTRTVSRRLRRQELWNGNREGPFWRIVVDPEHIVRWAWTSHGKTTPRMTALSHDRPDLPVVRLHNRAEVAHWLDGPLRAVTRGERS